MPLIAARHGAGPDETCKFPDGTDSQAEKQKGAKKGARHKKVPGT